MRRSYGLFFVIVLAVLLMVPQLRADWVADGVDICTAANVQRSPRIAPDAARGYFVTWQDGWSGVDKVYVQRVRSNGTYEFAADGIAVCTEASTQREPDIASDGVGGVIISWHDNRAGNWDMYAQRVDADGNLLWGAGGAAVAATSGLQIHPQVVTDGIGGVIIAWQDDRNGNNDIYAQRMDGTGAAQWTAGGVAICTATGLQGDPRIASDGIGGAIVVWGDGRSGTGDIYAQRVSNAGAVQWMMDGAPVCTQPNIQAAPEIAADGTGGAILVWRDYRNGSYDVYAQRLNSSGVSQWTAGGTAICTAPTSQRATTPYADGTGGAIFTWVDYRNAVDGDIYAQRLNASGAAQWTNDGRAVCAISGTQVDPRLARDGAGGVIITWEDRRLDTGDIYAQRMDVDGAPLWTVNGIPVCAASNRQLLPRIYPGQAGSVLIAWEDERNGAADIYGLAIDGDGNIVATMLHSYAARIEGRGIMLEWTLSQSGGGIRFFILRSGDGDRFEELGAGGIECEGLSYRWTDTGLTAGKSYRYRVDVLDEAGRRALFETEPVAMPAAGLVLYQNHPNPFNPVTTIGYYLPERGRVMLDVYDVRGGRVARLVDGVQPPGYRTAGWDGRDDEGRRVASGVYFCRLRVGKTTMTRKMSLLK